MKLSLNSILNYSVYAQILCVILAIIAALNGLKDVGLFFGLIGIVLNLGYWVSSASGLDVDE